MYWSYHSLLATHEPFFHRVVSHDTPPLSWFDVAACPGGGAGPPQRLEGVHLQGGRLHDRPPQRADQGETHRQDGDGERRGHGLPRRGQGPWLLRRDVLGVSRRGAQGGDGRETARQGPG